MNIYIKNFEGNRLLGTERCNNFKTAELRAEEAKGDSVYCIVTRAERAEVPKIFGNVKGKTGVFGLKVR